MDARHVAYDIRIVFIHILFCPTCDRQMRRISHKKYDGKFYATYTCECGEIINSVYIYNLDKEYDRYGI